jgi:WD40 repeat protein
MQKTTQNFLQATIFGYIVDTVMNRVDHLALSANGSRLVSGSTGRSGGTVCVWDTNTGECQHILKDPQGHRNPVWANALVDISANGKIIVSCCADNKVKVWNGDTGALLKTLRGIMDNLNTLAISADGLYIVSGSGQVRLWETSTGEVLKIFNTRSGSYARPAASVAVAHQYWTRQTHRRSSSTELMLITAIASGNRSDVVLPEHVWEYVFKFLSGSLVVAYAAYTDIEINFF